MSTQAADVIDATEVSEEWEDLFAPQNVQLPAAPKADAYAAYVHLAAGMSRGDPERLQKMAIRIGQLCGEDGFYSFPAGGGRIEGPSVRLAKALANVWGRVGFGVEIDRVERDRVYLTGVCVDFIGLAVVRRGSTFALAPAPRGFAKSAEQRTRWETMQVQSGGSRALRGAILDCLPSWFVAPAFEAAKSVAAKGGGLRPGQTLETARDEAVKVLGQLGLTRDQLEAIVGSPIVQWSIGDISDLRSLVRALRSGETTVEEVLAATAGPTTTATEGDRLSGLGLGKPPAAAPSTTATPPPPPSTTAGGVSPAGSPTDVATAEPPREGGKAKGPSKAEREQADDDARKLGDRLITRGPGSRVALDQVRSMLREVQSIRRVSDERFTRAIDVGAADGRWTVDGDAIVLAGAPAAEPPPESAPDRWTDLGGDELLEAVEGTAIRVGDAASERAKTAAGLGDWSDERVTDQATDEQLRELGRALDREESAFRSAAGEVG